MRKKIHNRYEDRRYLVINFSIWIELIPYVSGMFFFLQFSFSQKQTKVYNLYTVMI